MALCETETKPGLCTKIETSRMGILFFTHLKIVEKEAKITKLNAEQIKGIVVDQKHIFYHMNANSATVKPINLYLMTPTYMVGNFKKQQE